MDIKWDPKADGFPALGCASIDPDAAAEALGPTLWLLERASDGVELTQTGALNRALVREFAECWPDWWDADLFGPPHRETDVNRLWELHQLLRSLKLVYRRGGRIATSKRGRALQDDPPELLRMLAAALLEGDSFEADCANLVAPLLIAGVKAEYGTALAERILPVVADGWWTADGPVDLRDVSWAIAEFLRPAEAIGLLQGTPPDEMILCDVGRAALVVGLRARAPWLTSGVAPV